MSSLEMYLSVISFVLFVALCICFSRYRLYKRAFNESLVVLNDYADLVADMNSKNKTAKSVKGEK